MRLKNFTIIYNSKKTFFPCRAYNKLKITIDIFVKTFTRQRIKIPSVFLNNNM
jgi:hypothetical protein